MLKNKRERLKLYVVKKKKKRNEVERAEGFN